MNGLFFSIAIAVMWSLGFMTGYSWLEDDAKNNAIEGYHCTPITKHAGIESAKAQVAKYQAMVRG